MDCELILPNCELITLSGGPMLHWPTGLAVPLLPSLAPRATLPLQRNERGVELVLALMALEVVADFLPAHATAAAQRYATARR